MATEREQSQSGGDFIIGQDDFADLRFNPALGVDGLYYLYDKARQRPVKQFVLAADGKLQTVCRLTLLKRGDKFTPRLEFSRRSESNEILKERNEASRGALVKARVDLGKCHEAFWSLILCLQALLESEIPQGSFSLVSQAEGDIVSAVRERGPESVVSIMKKLSSTPGLTLSDEDFNQMARRKEKLSEFRVALTSTWDELAWQDFFEANKWIFGYGLNYQILRQEQSQPHLGGTRVGGRGTRKGDYLTSTMGIISFTVLVEIKTPGTKLLFGEKEIRNGAWSLSRKLTDALSQIEADIAEWSDEGSKQRNNRDDLEGRRVYTVQPKGIIVIGSLEEARNDRSKWETFQRFRQSIHGVEIITFDELYERAKFIVDDGVGGESEHWNVPDDEAV
jgi:hypothetical protein